ncbi:MAG: YitT family protein [Clostridiaceae bacterium]
MKQIAKNIFYILIGTLISSIGINLFIVKAHLLSGGVSGIALIIQYIFNISAGYSVILMNIPLIILSLIKINKKFTILTIVGTTSLSFFLILSSKLNTVISVNDPLLLCLYGGAINGIGMGIVFSNHGSTGGFDIISSLIRKKYNNFEIGKIIFFFNLFIVSLSAILFSLTTALYTLVSMYITAVFIDKVINGFNKKKLLFIVSKKEKEISSCILKDLKRGVTFIKGEGAYTGQDKNIIYCVVPLKQLPKVKMLIEEIDPNAFISILDASEIEGKGFANNLN